MVTLTKVLSIDIETYSTTDIAKSGVHKYVEDPEFEVMLFAYSEDYGPATVIDLMMGEFIPRRIVDMLFDPSVLKTAYNAPFERNALARHFGRHCPAEQWECSMVLGAVSGYPLGLDKLCKALGLDDTKAKMTEGKRLVKYFCTPCKPPKNDPTKTRHMPWDDPEKWAKFKEYNKQDVVAENEIRKLLIRNRPDATEHKFWCLDQYINDTGIRIDMQLARNASAIGNGIKDDLINQARRLTGLENPASNSQLKAWLEDVEGIEFPSFAKEAMPDVWAQVETEEGKAVLKMREQWSLSSLAKYEAMLEGTCADDRARGLFQFYGAARTGRFSGRRIQLQNLKRNSIKDLATARAVVREGRRDILELLYDGADTLSELVRTALIAEEGCRFIVADFSAIEARVIAWFAGEEWVLDEFRGAGKIYEATAANMFHVPKELIVKGRPEYELRQKGKVATLACIAEGSPVLTDQGLVPIEQVTAGMRLWDGENWVTHDGVIYRGEREVITYGGLTATPDHLVWVEGQQRPIRFGDAASSGAHLVQTGDGRNPLRMGGDHQPGEEMVPKLEPLLRPDEMYRLRNHQVDCSGESNVGKVQGLSSMLETTEGPSVAEQKTDSSETAVRESEGCAVPLVRREGNPIRLPERLGCGSIHTGELQSVGQSDGDRQNRHEWELRPREYSDGNQTGECREQKPDSSVGVGSSVLALCEKCRDQKTIEGDDQGRSNRRCTESGTGQEEKLARYSGKVRVYDIRNAGPNHRFTVSGKLVHNCSYGGGVGALKAFGADKMGVSEAELQGLVDQWRAANSNIVKWWYSLERAALSAVREKGVRVDKRGGIIFSFEDGNLYMTLPAGRRLCYPKAHITKNRFGNDSIGYWGQSQTTGQWCHLETYSGKLAENATQATARDCLRDSMLRLADAGFDIRAHVHDEVIINEPYGSGRTEQDVCDIMGIPPEWAPGLPLSAASYETFFYLKD